MGGPSRDDITTRLARIFQDTFGIPAAQLTPDASVRGSLQLDSMEVVSLVEEIEHEFGLARGKTSLEAYGRLDTIDAIVTYVETATRS